MGISKNTIVLGFAVVLTLLLFTLFIYLTNAMLEQAPILGRTEQGNTLSAMSVASETELPAIVSHQPYRTSNSLYSWEAADNHTAYDAVLAYELSKYPDEFFREVEIDKIYVVSNIQKGERGILGFADTMTGEIYLNAVSAERAQTDLIRSTIHHEIAHMFLMDQLGYQSLRGDRWQAIGGSEYGARDSSSQLFPEEGFVSSYATSSATEDMAEVFAFIMTDSYARLLANTDDGIIAAKAKYIKRLMLQTSLRESELYVLPDA